MSSPGRGCAGKDRTRDTLGKAFIKMSYKACRSIKRQGAGGGIFQREIAKQVLSLVS